MKKVFSVNGFGYIDKRSPEIAGQSRVCFFAVPG